MGLSCLHKSGIVGAVDCGTRAIIVVTGRNKQNFVVSKYRGRLKLPGQDLVVVSLALGIECAITRVPVL